MRWAPATNGRPAGQLLLSAATVGEKKNFVWEIPDVDLAQQITCVLGSRITGDEYLSRLSESKIEERETRAGTASGFDCKREAKRGLAFL